VVDVHDVWTLALQQVSQGIINRLGRAVVPAIVHVAWLRNPEQANVAGWRRLLDEAVELVKGRAGDHDHVVAGIGLCMGEASDIELRAPFMLLACISN
jgi:hypothetical protein